VLLPLVLAACSSGSGSGSGSPTTAGGGATQLSNGQLQGAGTTVLHQMDSYTSTSSKCTSATSPVVCVEAADRTLGGQIHTYANLLAVGHGFHAPGGDLSNARDAAQTLANSLEILGDAEPTQANYDQVLNTFNIASAIHSLQGDVTKLNGQLG
jgi:hypothetical protein